MKSEYRYEVIPETDNKIFVKHVKLSIDWNDYKTLLYIFLLLSIVIWFFLSVFGLVVGCGLLIKWVPALSVMFK